MMCPVHSMPDCSPILNGCSLPDQLVKGSERVGYEVRATHHHGFRYGHKQPWGTVKACVYDAIVGRVVFRIEWPDEVTDSWVYYDPADPYEFRSPQGLAHSDG